MLFRSAHQQIQASASELQRIATEESALANGYRPGGSFENLVVELNGNGQSPGRIAQLEAELQQPPPPKSNLSAATFEALGNDAAALVNELRRCQQQLAASSQQVSFKQLYEAVVQVQQSSPEACPACKTPLQQVQVNPYINAGQELTRLQQLGELQQKVVQLEQSALQAIFKLGQSLNTCLQYFSVNNPLKPFELVNMQPGLQWWDSLFTPLPDAYTAWQHLTSQIQKLETKDKQAEEVIRNRDNKQVELNRLRTDRKSVV